MTAPSSGRSISSTPSGGGSTTSSSIRAEALWQSRLREASGLESLPATRILRATGGTAIAKLSEPVAPEGTGMSVVGFGALVVNLYCAIILNKFKDIKGGLAKAAYFSARNDAVSNILIIVVGLLTLVWISPVPDLIVGAVIFFMNADSARDILNAARAEHRESAH